MSRPPPLPLLLMQHPARGGLCGAAVMEGALRPSRTRTPPPPSLSPPTKGDYAGKCARHQLEPLSLAPPPLSDATPHTALALGTSGRGSPSSCGLARNLASASKQYW